MSNSYKSIVVQLHPQSLISINLLYKSEGVKRKLIFSFLCQKRLDVDLEALGSCLVKNILKNRLLCIMHCSTSFLKMSISIRNQITGKIGLQRSFAALEGLQL